MRTLTHISCAVLLMMLVGGCAKKPVTWPRDRQPIQEDPLPPRAETPPAPEPETPKAQPNPRAMAALTFSEQGQAYLESGNADAAIRTLERAVNLYPQNGKNYYYLAEAWLLKQNALQASEYNRLATIYFKDDPEWLARAQTQLDRIYSRLDP